MLLSVEILLIFVLLNRKEYFPKRRFPNVATLVSKILIVLISFNCFSMNALATSGFNICFFLMGFDRKEGIAHEKVVIIYSNISYNFHFHGIRVDKIQMFIQ